MLKCITRRLLWWSVDLAVLGGIVLLAISQMHKFEGIVPNLWESPSRQSSALTVLQSMDLEFLATNKVASSIVVEQRSGNFLLGYREGYLVADCTLYFGIDLREAVEEPGIIPGGKSVIILPEPKALDFSVDMDSVRFLTRQSGLMLVADALQDNDAKAALLRQLQVEAIEYLQDREMLPDKATIVQRLNAIVPRLGLEVEFR